MASSTRHLIDVMGTVVTVDLFHVSDNDEARDAVERVRALLVDVDRVFSTYKASSPVSRLRRGELTLGETPPQVADVLDLCQQAKTLTGGWFDPWALPGGVDPTGYVKGWAAQLALEELRALDVTGAIVNAAGDIASFGGPDLESNFRTGIVRPDDPQRFAAVVELRGCLATSGEAERGAHLFNPFSHTFVSAVASASVTGPNLGVCDAFATALSVGGHDVMVLIDKVDGYEAMTLDFAGSMRATPGFAFVRE
ncbi:MAG: FAD:protein FMN transferase [Acidimicrobiaceae bacterium]|nr:FAD:protein FMN transferase [Acidimicrobiaceae bacterium]